MPILERLTKYKSSPVAIIIKGANALGVEVANLLIEQGAYVILVDEFNQENKKKVMELTTKDLFSFVDVSGLKSLCDSIPRLDYVFFLNHAFRAQNDEISTSEFLERSNTLDKLLQLCANKNSRFLLTSSLHLHEMMQSKRELVSDIEENSLSYTILEVQRYAENLTWEYLKQSGVDARIIRIGTMLGEGIDTSERNLVFQYIKNAISGEKLVIEGDGLEHLYFIHVQDAAYGLIKALFTKGTSGNIYSLCFPSDMTVLNLAYKILDLEPKASGIEFVEPKKKSLMSIYKPAPNLKTVGWKPKISLERALAQTIDYVYTQLGKEDLLIKRREEMDAKEESKDAARTLESESVPKKRGLGKLKDSIMNFFFEQKYEVKNKSILDNVKFASNKAHARGREGAEIKYTVTNRLSRKSSTAVSRSSVKTKAYSLQNSVGRWMHSITLLKFFSYLLVGTLLLSIYLIFIAPVIRIAYHGAFAYLNMKRAAEDFSSQDYAKVSGHLATTSKALSGIEGDLENLSFLKMFKFYESIRVARQNVRKARETTDNMKMVFDELGVFERYLDEYKSNISLTATNNLTAGDAVNYNLSALNDVNSTVADIDPFLYPSDSFLTINSKKIPIVQSSVETFINDLNSLHENCNSVIPALKLLPTLFGTQKPETYILLLLDNSKVRPQGGNMVAVIFFTISGGNVLDPKVYSPSEIKLSLSSEQLSLVQREMGVLYPSSGVTFADLTLVQNESTFRTLVSSAFKGNEGVNNAHIVTINFVALKELVSLFGGIRLSDDRVINSVNFNDLIYGSDISYPEVLARLMQRLFSFTKEDIFSLGKFFSENLSNKDITLITNDANLNSYSLTEGFKYEEARSDYPILEISFVSDSQVLPVIDVDSSSVMSGSGMKVSYRLNLKQETEPFNGIALVQFDPETSINAITPFSSIIKQDGNTMYLYLNLSVNQAQSFTFDTEKSFEDNTTPKYNLISILKKPKGFAYNFSDTLTYSGSLKPETLPQGTILDGNELVSEGYLAKDQFLEFVFVNM